MQQTIESKLNGMFWDMSPVARHEALESIINDPVKAFNDKQILLRVLNTLSWYELVKLAGGPENMVKLLDDTIIARLFPETRREYYRNARRLLSKYIISVIG